jgi:Flp pilus assembly pilin Flp
MLKSLLRRSRLRKDKDSDHPDKGASALEWAIIAAVTVLMVSVIGGVIFNIVTEKSADLQDCSDQPVGSVCDGAAGQ